VQLPRSTYVDSSGGSMSMYVLDALDYILRKAKDVQHLVINLSFGSTAGPHDGSSLLERGIDALIARAREDRAGQGSVQLVVPAGNHFLQKVHGCVTLTQQQPRAELVWQVMPDDLTDSFLELWWPAQRHEDLAVTLESPSGKKLERVTMGAMGVLRDAGQAVAAVVSGLGTSNGAGSMVLIALARTETMYPPCAEHGAWKVTLESSSEQDLVVDAWIQRDDGIRRGTVGSQSRLLSTQQRTVDSPDTPQDPVKRRATGNSLANGAHTVVVGACVGSSVRLPGPESARFKLSDYSGAAPPGRDADWPHYVAAADESDSLPGLLVAGTRSGIRVRMNGTSVAAPQVARCLLNEAVQGSGSKAPAGQAQGTIADQRGQVAKLVVWK
jgi:hypothetical protein